MVRFPLMDVLKLLARHVLRGDRMLNRIASRFNTYWSNSSEESRGDFTLTLISTN